MENRGVKAIFVGYSKNHSSDTYRLIKEENKVVLLSRDYEWSGNIDNQEPESNKDIEEINHEYIIIEDEEDTEVNGNVSTQRDDDNDVDVNSLT